MKRTRMLLLFLLAAGCAPPQTEQTRPVGLAEKANVATDAQPAEKAARPGAVAGSGPAAAKAESPIAGPAYNESANAKADIAAAIKTAQTANLPVLVVFGADWCGDCKKLDAALQSGRTATLVNSSFKTVKIFVGKFNKNTELAEEYGVPLRKGIPTIAVLSANGDVLYTTKDGELANARKMGDDGLFAFFSQLAAKTKR